MCILWMGGIKSEAKAFTISAPTSTVYTNQQLKLKVSPSAMKGKVKWKTSDKKVAAVSSKGIVTGKKAGKATIYAISSENSKQKAAFQIKVKAFKGKSLSAKASIIRFTPLEFPGSKNGVKVFGSRKEIDDNLKLHKSFSKDYAEKDRKYTSIGKILKQYKKSFFKKNSLCLMYVTSGSSSMPVSAKNIELKQY